MLADSATHFFAVHFTPAELAYAKSHISEDPARHLAARYAAKEAVIKALSGARETGGGGRPLDYREIEVLSLVDGAPRLAFHDVLAERVRAAHITRWHLSLSHDGDVAVAVVVFETVGECVGA